MDGLLIPGLMCGWVGNAMGPSGMEMEGSAMVMFIKKSGESGGGL